MSDMVTHIHENGRSTTVQVIEFGFEKPPKHVQDLFDAGDDAVFQRAIRVRRLQKRPILYVTSYIPETIRWQFGAADMEKRPVWIGWKMPAFASRRESSGSPPLWPSRPWRRD